jgi:hypothetical protein
MIVRIRFARAEGRLGTFGGFAACRRFRDRLCGVEGLNERSCDTADRIAQFTRSFRPNDLLPTQVGSFLRIRLQLSVWVTVLSFLGDGRRL